MFAIDWMKLDAQGRMYVGDNTKVEKLFRLRPAHHFGN